MIFLIGAVVFFVILFVLLIAGHYKDKALVQKTHDEWVAHQKKYGEPKYGLGFDPVHVLKSKIPQAPFGYLWEIKIVKENDEYGLSLGIFNLKEEIIEDFRVMNISKINSNPANKDEYMSVAQYYVPAGLVLAEVDKRSDTLIAHFTGPLIAWSKSQKPVIAPKVHEELDLELTAGGLDAVKKVV